MGYPTTISNRLTVTDANVYYPVPCGSGVKLAQIAISGPASAWTLDAYSRKFTGLAIAISSITKYGDGSKVLLDLVSRHDFRVGDPITLANTGVGAYNGAGRIVSEVIDNNTVVLVLPYVSDVVGVGTGQLVIPTTEYSAWRVGTQQTAAAGILNINQNIVYRCEDAQTNIGDARLIYLRFSATGNYLINITCEKEDHG